MTMELLRRFLLPVSRYVQFLCHFIINTKHVHCVQKKTPPVRFAVYLNSNEIYRSCNFEVVLIELEIRSVQRGICMPRS